MLRGVAALTELMKREGATDPEINDVFPEKYRGTASETNASEAFKT